MKYRAVLHYDLFTDRQVLVVRTKDGYLSAITEKACSGMQQMEPLMDGDSVEFVQAIMDAGWKAGLKPLGYEDASRELTATKFHLEDMRILAKVIK